MEYLGELIGYFLVSLSEFELFQYFIVAVGVFGVVILIKKLIYGI